MQYLVVSLVVLAALLYALKPFFEKKKKKDVCGCGDCSGCALMDQSKLKKK